MYIWFNNPFQERIIPPNLIISTHSPLYPAHSISLLVFGNGLNNCVKLYNKENLKSPTIPRIWSKIFAYENVKKSCHLGYVKMSESWPIIKKTHHSSMNSCILFVGSFFFPISMQYYSSASNQNPNVKTTQLFFPFFLK